jgi:hypothetical protein
MSGERTLTALEDMTWTFDNIAGIVEVVSLTLNMATWWMVILTIDLFAREEWGCFGEYRVASKGRKCYSDSHLSESRIMDLWRVDMLLVRSRRCCERPLLLIMFRWWCAR